VAAQDAKDKLVAFTANEERAAKAIEKEFDQARRLREFKEELSLITSFCIVAYILNCRHIDIHICKLI
jgi:hypothetical protein